MSQIRILDLGEVPPVRSQTIYHAVARAMGPGTPNTIILVTGQDPYVSIGYHQDLHSEVDVEYCADSGLPVVRREVGGGAVYLDRNQMFSQWVFQPESLPTSLEDQFELYVRPLVATYQTLGIDAYLRPVNDIHVDNRKIGGTGAAQIGQARVLVGSLMFDFDKHTMACVLKVPDEKMRDKVVAGLEQYMVTMRDLLPEEPDRAETIATYLEECAAVLDAELVHDEPSARELEIAGELDELFVSPQWLNRKTVLPREGVKIHEDVSIVGGVHKAPGGLIRAAATKVNGSITDVSFSGDFTILPAAGLAAIETAAAGSPGGVVARLGALFAEAGFEAPGVAPEHFAAALLGKNGGS
jgi:lipoate-protein ligase A